MISHSFSGNCRCPARKTPFKKVGLMTQPRPHYPRFVPKAIEQTFVGTHFVLQKACATTGDLLSRVTQELTKRVDEILGWNLTSTFFVEHRVNFRIKRPSRDKWATDQRK